MTTVMRGAADAVEVSGFHVSEAGTSRRLPRRRTHRPTSGARPEHAGRARASSDRRSRFPRTAVVVLTMEHEPAHAGVRRRRRVRAEGVAHRLSLISRRGSGARTRGAPPRHLRLRRTTRPRPGGRPPSVRPSSIASATPIVWLEARRSGEGIGSPLASIRWIVPGGGARADGVDEHDRVGITPQLEQVDGLAVVLAHAHGGRNAQPPDDLEPGCVVTAQVVADPDHERCVSLSFDRPSARGNAWRRRCRDRGCGSPARSAMSELVVGEVDVPLDDTA